MGLAGYLVNRFFQLVAIVLIGILASFFLFRLLPGDPTASLLDPRLDPEARAEIIRRFGLDKPLGEQFAAYMVNLFRGDLGVSFRFTGEPVVSVITGPRLFNTLALMGAGILLGAIVGTFLGLVAGWRSGGLLDRILTGGLYMGLSAPVFWVALLIQFLLGYKLGLIPIGGTSSYEGAPAPLWSYFADYLWHMAGPLTTLVLFYIPGYFMYIRNVVSDIRGEDFVTTLRALGLRERVILVGHVFRHAAIQMITITANYSPLLVTGAVFTETVFGWNGLGRLLYDSILGADYPVLQGIFLMTILIVALANLLADIAYYLVDPRIRAAGGRG